MESPPLYQRRLLGTGVRQTECPQRVGSTSSPRAGAVVGQIAAKSLACASAPPHRRASSGVQRTPVRCTGQSQVSTLAAIRPRVLPAAPSLKSPHTVDKQIGLTSFVRAAGLRKPVVAGTYAAGRTIGTQSSNPRYALSVSATEAASRRIASRMSSRQAMCEMPLELRTTWAASSTGKPSVRCSG